MCFLPHVFRQCGFDKLAQSRLNVRADEINTQTNASGLSEQWLEDREDRQLCATTLRNRRCPQEGAAGLFREVNRTKD
jgi:hypothetical protein